MTVSNIAGLTLAETLTPCQHDMALMFISGLEEQTKLYCWSLMHSTIMKSIKNFIHNFKIFNYREHNPQMVHCHPIPPLFHHRGGISSLNKLWSHPLWHTRIYAIYEQFYLTDRWNIHPWAAVCTVNGIFKIKKQFLQDYWFLTFFPWWCLIWSPYAPQSCHR